MHIGYLVQQFPPEVGAGPARVLELARLWIAAGARVTVFTGMPNRPEGRIHPGYRGKLFVDETVDGITVFRSWLYASPTPGFVRTITNNATFMLTSALRGTSRAKNLDVLIASSPPFFPHISGQAVSLIRRIPLVLEVRDLWPEYLVDMGVLRRGSIGSRALFAVERKLLQRADAVTVVTESFRQRIVQKGVSPDDVHVMPAGVDGTAYYRSEEPPPLAHLVRRSDAEFIVGYLGNFGAGQALSAVLDAAALLSDRKPCIRFVLAGDGPERAQLERLSASRGLGNLSINAPIPKAQTRSFYANCDICLVPLAPVPIFQETIPSKIFEILACERPLIAGVAGEAERVVAASQGGWVVPPGDAARLADAILAAAATPEADRALMGQRGRAHALAHFSREVIAQRYLVVLEAVAGKNQTATSAASVRSPRRSP